MSSFIVYAPTYYIEFDPPLSSSFCVGEEIDITVKGVGRFYPGGADLIDCAWDGYAMVYWCLKLMEADTLSGDDDIAGGSTCQSSKSYDCASLNFDFTFQDVDLSTQFGGFEDQETIEVYAKIYDFDGKVGVSSSSESDVNKADCECTSGACCDLSTKTFKPSGSQPTGYTDEYICSGSNTPVGTNWVYKTDYYCNGQSSSAKSSNLLKDTCGPCQYCTTGDSTCNYYGSSTICGTRDCDGLDTACRDYHDKDRYCNGAGSCSSSSCDSYTNEPKHTSCGTGKECNGVENCVTCASHEYSSCYTDDVYWYDRCDNREEIKQDCGDDSHGSWTEYCNGNDLRRKRNYFDRYCSSSSCYTDVINQDEKIKTCQTQCIDQGGYAYCKEICYQDSDCGTESRYNPHCVNDDVYMTYSVPHCVHPGQQDSYCYRTEEDRLVEPCSYGCSGGECEQPDCTDKCSSGQTRCSGDYKQTCGNYDSDLCLEWPGTGSGSGNEYCEFGCENNDCVSEIACYVDEDCGWVLWRGPKLCVNGDVWEYGQAWQKCINPGTTGAECVEDIGIIRSRKKIECGENYCNNWKEDFCFGGDDVWHEKDCFYFGCQVATYNCYSTTGGEMEKVKDCQEGCTDGMCNEDFCFDDCSSWQTRCNGNYQQSCGNYDGDQCLEWPLSTSGGGNQYCENGCTANQCICINHTTLSCYNNDVYWYDSCGNREEIKEDCSHRCYLGECLQSFNLELKTGWNLLSFPLDLLNKKVENIFDYYSKIFTYDNKWIELDNNSEMNEDLGYWVKVDNGYLLEIEGKELGGMNLNLGNGWNLISYPYMEKKDISELSDNITVFAYNNSEWYSYDSDKPLNSLDEFIPGYGYWVKK